MDPYCHARDSKIEGQPCSECEFGIFGDRLRTPGGKNVLEKRRIGTDPVLHRTDSNRMIDRVPIFLGHMGMDQNPLH